MYEGGLSSRQIAEEIGIPSRTVSRYLRDAGANIRNPGAPRNEKLQDAEFLSEMYLAQLMSTTQIAQIVGCEPSRVSFWLRQHGIPTRSVGAEKGHRRNTPEARRKMSRKKRGKMCGKENPNWRGGISRHDPERNRYRAKVWSQSVRLRDGVCQECGAFDRLHAHHLKRWKDYPELRYELSNGVTLCHTCHERAHGRGFKFRWLK